MNWGKATGGLLGLMAGSEALGGPEDAQAAARPDLLEAFYRAFNNPRAPSTLMVGTLPETALKDAQSLNGAYRNPEAWLSWHGVNSRFDKDGMMPDTFVEMMRQVLDSDKTRTIPGFPSKKNVKRTASEALWLPKDAESPFFPIAPRKDGKVLLVTGFPKDTGEIIDHVVERNWNPDSRQSIISGVHRTLSAGEPSPQPRRISAVGPQFAGTSLGDLLAKRKRKLPGAAWIPAGASAFGGSSGMSDGSFGHAMRQLGLGTRATMEGLGNSLSLGLADPGRGLADWVGLPAPAPGTPEASVSNAVRGGADVMGWVVPGAGVARTATGPVARGVGQALSSHPGTQVALGSGLGYAMEGLGGLLGMLGRAHEMQDEEEW